MTIQSKTTLLFTALTAVVFSVLTLTVYYFSQQFVYSDFYKRLELRARIAAKYRFEEGHVSTESFKVIQQQFLERLPEEKSYFLQLGSDNRPVPPVEVRLPAAYLKQISEADGATRYFQDRFVHYAGLQYKDGKQRWLVIESAQNTYGAQIIERLGTILIITFLGAVLLIYAVGRYLSRSTFAPFRQLTSRVQTISEVNLHLRLPERQGADEVAVLIKTFNTMLSRLETAFASQQNFISHASHELRTPLSTILASADYALSRDRPASQYRESLELVMQQAEKLQKLTGGLLSFAQVSFDGKKQSWERVPVASLIDVVYHDIEAMCPGRLLLSPDIAVLAESPMVTTGNLDLLRIAIGNVVLNGCKYSEGPVRLLVSAAANHHMLITVEDRGIGIPPEALPQVTEPFFRASNTAGIEGYGIGLPMTATIIRLHNGRLELSSIPNEGTSVHIFLPLS